MQVLFVGGLFPPFIKGIDRTEYVIYEAGVRWMAAVQMAIDKVNSRTDLLSGTQVCCSLFSFVSHLQQLRVNPIAQLVVILAQLELLTRHGKFETDQSTAEAFRLVQSRSIGIIGPSASTPSSAVASLLSRVPELNRAMVGYGATSEKLTDFSNLARTIPVDTVVARYMAKLMRGLFETVWRDSIPQPS